MFISRQGVWFGLFFQAVRATGVALAALAFVPSVEAQCPNFGAVTSYATAVSAPVSVVIGDFNEDGLSDLAVAGLVNSRIAILLGTGTGSFGTPTFFATWTNPRSVAIGDFNADGVSDLAVGTNGSNVAIHLGTGTGTFGPAVIFAAGQQQMSVAIGDFNEDGWEDLVTANSVPDNVSILLGTGAGTFATATNLAVGMDPRSVAIGDFNGDGRSDLAVANEASNDVSVLLGTGTGTFVAATTVAAQTSPSSVAVGDFNGDGWSDLAVANMDSNTVSVLLGTGTGTFGAAANFATGTGPISVAIGDFNGDGRSDLAVANETSNNVSILLATGTGAFVAATNFGAGGLPRSVAIGDFNGDGLSDVAVAGGSGASVLLNAGCPPVVTSISPSSGPTTGGTVVTITGSNFVVGATTVNFGTVAATVSCSSTTRCTATSPAGSGPVSVRATTSAGTSADTAADNFTYASTEASACAAFSAPTNLTVETNPVALAIGDFNGDGQSDLAVANLRSSSVSLLLATGPGTFAAATSVAVGANPRGVAIGDFNGDGFIDLAVANELSSDVSILLGTVTGAFGPATTVLAGAAPISVATGDFNGDGRVDLAVANSGEDTVSILLGTGAGTFGAATNFPTGSNPRVVAVGDFDGDGRSDLAVANFGSDTVSILLGTGTGTFGAATGFAAGTGPVSVAIGDFNDDGLSDLTVANPTTNTISVLPGTGTGTFGAATSFGAGTNPTAVAIGDFNHDGRSDLAATNVNSDNVSILLGSGAGTFGTATDFVTGSGPFSAVVGDFNADGRSDLAVTNQRTDDVSVLFNVAPAPGTLALSAAAYSVNEAAGTVTITVNRTGGSDCTVTVNYTTASGTATTGSDYTATSGVLTFGTDVTSQTFTVPITNDTSDEPDETFTVTLTTPGGDATLGVPATATVTIVDDDAAPDVTLSLTGSPLTEADGLATVTATLSAVSEQTVTVNLGFSGTATLISDYSRSGTVIVIPAGSNTGSITLTAVQDTLNEANETILVEATAVTNGTPATPWQVTAIITDDDAAATLAIDNVTQAEGTGGSTNFLFTVTLTGSTAQTVTVNYATVDATANTPADYSATSGTLTFAAGTLTQTITVPVVGDALNEAVETFAVLLSAGTNATIATAAGTGTITNDDAVPTLTINSASQVEGNSGPTNMDFRVTLSAPSGETVTVSYSTADGSATAGSDYTPTNGTLTFAPGVTTQTFPVPIVGDPLDEPTETFTVTLSAPSNAIITEGSGAGTIVNDDGAPTLSISSPSQAEGDSGTTDMSFAVTLSPASGQIVTVSYATADGTATAGSDYTAVSSVLVFTPGTTSQIVVVSIPGDTLHEADETFTVSLSSAVNATVATATASGTIVNDDAPGTLSIDSASQAEGNSGTTTMSFTVTLSAPSDEIVTASYTTGDGSAVAGSDYTSDSGTLTFAPGVLTQSIAVPVIGDNLDEPDETFTVTLSAATNATITIATGTGTIENDDAVASPSIATVGPTSGPMTGSQSVTITGTNLSGTIAVTFGGVAGSITGNTETSITVITPAHPAGTVDVVVTTAGGSTTSPGAYTFAAAAAVAAIPTLSEWMLLALMAMFAAAGLGKLRAS